MEKFSTKELQQEIRRRQEMVNEDAVQFRKDVQRFLETAKILNDEMIILEEKGKIFMEKYGIDMMKPEERLLLESMRGGSLIFFSILRLHIFSDGQ